MDGGSCNGIFYLRSNTVSLFQFLLVQKDSQPSFTKATVEKAREDLFSVRSAVINKYIKVVATAATQTCPGGGGRAHGS